MAEQYPYWLEIDHQAIINNLIFLRRLISSKTKLFPVIKSNAYGHGLLAVAQTLQARPEVTGVVVNSIEEALLLRNNLFSKRILVAGAFRTRDLVIAARDHGIELEVVNCTDIALLQSIPQSTLPLKIHIKLNTGLNRLGFNELELASAMKKLKNNSDVQIQGLFSHLANSENPQSIQTIHQISTFKKILQQYPGYENHIASSVGTLLIPEAHFDIVRVGISTYGLWPSPEVEILWHKQHPNIKRPPLSRALQFRSTIVHIAKLDAGEPIGYGGSFTTQRPTRIAILPCGYYEGLPRAWSNKASLLVCGKRASILGRIAMNMTTIDITDIPEANETSTVTIIGQDGDILLTAEEQAAFGDTINYELLARLPDFIPRKNNGPMR